MLAGSSWKFCVVSVSAAGAILLSSALVLMPQEAQPQQAALVSMTRPAPRLEVTPVPVQVQARPATGYKPVQPAKTVVQPTPAPKSEPVAPVPRVNTSTQAPEPPGGGVISNVLTSVDLPSGLLCIRGPWGKATHESGGDYSIHTEWPTGRESATTGAYEYDDQTWGGFMGYARAYLAPPWVQDLKALLDFNVGPQHRHQLWPHTSYLCGV
jgi:hypothetical protein